MIKETADASGPADRPAKAAIAAVEGVDLRIDAPGFAADVDAIRAPGGAAGCRRTDAGSVGARVSRWARMVTGAAVMSIGLRIGADVIGMDTIRLPRCAAACPVDACGPRRARIVTRAAIFRIGLRINANFIRIDAEPLPAWAAAYSVDARLTDDADMAARAAAVKVGSEVETTKCTKAKAAERLGVWTGAGRAGADLAELTAKAALAAVVGVGVDVDADRSAAMATLAPAIEGA